MDFYERQLGYTKVDSKKFRRGFTTGTAASAAAKACAIMAILGELPGSVRVTTAGGKELTVLIEDCHKKDNTYYAYVKKFAGDDIDVTKDALIGASLVFREDDELIIDGGRGVGRVTKKGLHQNIGEAAINPSPMRCIREEVRKVLGERGAQVVIFVPEGELLAEKTFNPRIGIVGGISILGTTGIVEPMSEEGYKKSLLAELSVKASKTLALTPGNYGEKFLNARGISSDKIVIISNFVGYMLREGVAQGADNILLAGHLGKLIKLSGGIFHTHSHVADAKNEIIVSELALNEAPYPLMRLVMESNTTEEALEHVKAYEMEGIWDKLAQRAKFRSEQHVYNKARVEVIFFNMEGRVVGSSADSEELVSLLRRNGGIV